MPTLYYFDEADVVRRMVREGASAVSDCDLLCSLEPGEGDAAGLHAAVDVKNIRTEWFVELLDWPDGDYYRVPPAAMRLMTILDPQPSLPMEPCVPSP